MADWARSFHTTIAEYVRGEEENVMRNRKIFALMQDRNRITYNHSGLNMDWKVRYRRAPMSGFGDGDTLTFSRQNRHVTATLDWRGYSATDMITGFEKEKNKGEQAIIKLFAELPKLLMDDIKDQFGDEPYIDGNAAGNTKRFHGIESFLSVSGAGTKQPIGLPNDTYAGLATTLANKGGSWSTTGTTTTNTDWPTGTGDAHYDYYSPLVVDYTSSLSTNTTTGVTGWAHATKTWPNTGVEAIGYLIQHTQRNKSKEGMLDLITLESELFRQHKEAARAKEQIMVERTGGTGLVKLGFTDVIHQDGVEITSEYGLPARIGYGWNVDAMELCSLLDVVFKAKGPDYDIASDGYRLAILIMGNFKFRQTRMFGKLINLT